MPNEEKLVSHYRLKTLLRKDGFGAVYAAEDTRDQKDYILRVVELDQNTLRRITGRVRAHSQRDHPLIEQIRQRMKRISELKNSHILSVIEFGEEHIQGNNDIIFYMVSPYERESLLSYWSEHTSSSTLISLEIVTELISQAAEALYYIHRRGLVHQYVRLSSFMLRSSTRSRRLHLYLTDFWFADITIALLEEGQIAQDLSVYLASEQLAGKAAFASDQYALAILAYELLLGYRLSGIDLSLGLYESFLRQRSLDETLEVSIAELELAHRLDLVLKRALTEDVRARFQNIEEFASTFRAVAAGELVELQEDTAKLPALGSRVSQSEEEIAVAAAGGLVAGEVVAEITEAQETLMEGEEVTRARHPSLHKTVLTAEGMEIVDEVVVDEQETSVSEVAGVEIVEVEEVQTLIIESSDAAFAAGEAAQRAADSTRERELLIESAAAGLVEGEAIQRAADREEEQLLLAELAAERALRAEAAATAFAAGMVVGEALGQEMDISEEQTQIIPIASGGVGGAAAYEQETDISAEQTQIFPAAGGALLAGAAGLAAGELLASELEFTEGARGAGAGLAAGGLEERERGGGAAGGLAGAGLAAGGYLAGSGAGGAGGAGSASGLAAGAGGAGGLGETEEREREGAGAGLAGAGLAGTGLAAGGYLAGREAGEAGAGGAGGLGEIEEREAGGAGAGLAEAGLAGAGLAAGGYLAGSGAGAGGAAGGGVGAGGLEETQKREAGGAGAGLAGAGLAAGGYLAGRGAGGAGTGAAGGGVGAGELGAGTGGAGAGLAGAGMSGAVPAAGGYFAGSGAGSTGGAEGAGGAGGLEATQERETGGAGAGLAGAGLAGAGLAAGGYLAGRGAGGAGTGAAGGGAGELGAGTGGAGGAGAGLAGAGLAGAGGAGGGGAGAGAAGAAGAGLAGAGLAGAAGGGAGAGAIGSGVGAGGAGGRTGAGLAGAGLAGAAAGAGAGAAAGAAGGGAAGGSPLPLPIRNRQRRSRALLIPLLLLLLLLLLGAGILGVVFAFNQSSAAVSLTLQSHTIQNTYLVTAITTTNTTSDQIHANLLTQTATQSKGGQSTGYYQGAQSHGFIRFYNSSTGCGCPVIIPAGTVFTSANGVSVMIDQTASVASLCYVTVRAHALIFGSGGDIPAGNLYAFYKSHVTATNPFGFSGGQSGQSNAQVQQSDIDRISKTLSAQVLQSVQTSIQGQITGNQRLFAAPLCSTKVKSNHTAGEFATGFTVTVTASCVAEAYDYDAAVQIVTQQVQTEASSFSSDQFVLLNGKLLTTVVSATVTDAKAGTLLLALRAVGKWVHKLTSHLANLIANKSVSEARTILMLAGASSVNISVSGRDSNTLPADSSKITIVVKS
ncbi:MAG TPA: hypothetical protein VGD98_03075 [Ktedonobacteraceae bacterium]